MEICFKSIALPSEVGELQLTKRIYASQLNDPDSDGYTTFTGSANYAIENGEYVITSIE